MNRIDFMKRVELLLSDLPESERREAIQYYNDYLNDAGVENEEEVLEALGTPEELAQSIREGVREGDPERGGFSEEGYSREPKERENEVISQKRDARKEGGRDYGRRYRAGGKKRGMSGGTVALIVILCILASPVILPVALALGIVAVVLAAVFIPLILVFLLLGVIFIAVGAVAFFESLADLFLFPAGALMGIGASLITVGCGILLTMLLVFLLGKLFPNACRKAADFCGGLFRKKGGRG